MPIMVDGANGNKNGGSVSIHHQLIKYSVKDVIILSNIVTDINTNTQHTKFTLFLILVYPIALPSKVVTENQSYVFYANSTLSDEQFDLLQYSQTVYIFLAMSFVS